MKELQIGQSTLRGVGWDKMLKFGRIKHKLKVYPKGNLMKIGFKQKTQTNQDVIRDVLI